MSDDLYRVESILGDALDMGIMDTRRDGAVEMARKAARRIADDAARIERMRMECDSARLRDQAQSAEIARLRDVLRMVLNEPARPVPPTWFGEEHPTLVLPIVLDTLHPKVRAEADALLGGKT